MHKEQNNFKQKIVQDNLALKNVNHAISAFAKCPFIGLIREIIALPFASFRVIAGTTQ